MSEQNTTQTRQQPRRHGPNRGSGMMPGEKPKDFKGTVWKLISYVKPHIWGMIVVWTLAIIGTIFSIISPKILGQATTLLVSGLRDKAMGIPGAGIDFTGIFKVLRLVFMFYVASSIFNYIQQTMMSQIAQKVVFSLRAEIDQKLSKLPLKYLDSNSTGDILSRVTNDVDTVSSTIQQSLTQVITSIVTVIGIIIMMLTIDWRMTLIMLLVIPLSAVVMMFFAKKSQTYFVQFQTKLGALNGQIEEAYSGQNIIKAFGKEEETIAKFSEFNDALRENARSAFFLSGLVAPILSFMGNLSYILIAVVGALFSIHFGLAVGDIQAFLQYSQQFMQPISQAANILNVLQSSVAAAERIFALLEEPEEEPVLNPQEITHPQGAVTFDHISFGYDPERMIIHDFNFEAKPGQTIAIVGPTGAGKTTIINLLMRFYDVNAGQILIDGVPVQTMDRNYLRSQFGMVLQDTWLFKGSIYDNIAYGNENATRADVLKAAKIANVDHFVRTLQHGYDTEINEEASNISQGQKQLLTIARAVIKDPKIMILDEATSSVDTRTEILIQNAMDELMKGRTSFVIAHRLSTIKNADVILVMNNGAIVEQGNHQTLLQQGGFYADLYNSQFQEEI